MIAEPEAREFLVAELGRGTVPVLAAERVGHALLLPESDAIIAFLRTYVNEGDEQWAA